MLEETEMTAVNIIFKEAHTAVRNSGGFVEGEEIKEVTWVVEWFHRNSAFMEIKFPESDSTYIYPWHTIARLKITE